MKKKILLAGAAMLLAATVVTGYTTHNKINVSDLLNANVEALAQGEMGSGYVTCYSSYNSCWFWNCSTVYNCGSPCVQVKCDGVGDEGACFVM